MADQTTPKLGTIITGTEGRDAVHIAVTPFLATTVLQPGQRLVNGIIDPYLKEPVQPGQWCYMFLYPLTITGLRHVWSHPSFPEEE